MNAWQHGHPRDEVAPLSEAEVKASLAPASTLTDSYRAYLEERGVLGHGFAFDELVRSSKRHILPMPTLWSGMVCTLRVAIELRARMLDYGATGLSLHAAYRPEGGARRSAHKANKALDLDLLKQDKSDGLARLYLQVTADLYSELLADGVRIGMGTYGHKSRTFRVHVDINHRHPARPNTWTMIGDDYIASAISGALEKR